MGQKRQYTRNAWRLAGGLVAGATLFACGSKPLNCTERQYPSPMTGGCVGLGEYMQQNDGAFPDGYEPEDAALPDAMDSGVATDSGDSGVLSRPDSSDVIDVIDASTTSDAEAGVDSATCDGGLRLCGATCVDTSTDRLNCGACGNACGPRTGATASCSMSACAYVCNAGFEETGGACDVAVARPVFPPGTSTVTMLRPTLKWALPMGVDGAQIELCRDRACTMVIERIDATGTSARPAMDLPRSTVVFWRLRGRVGSTAGTRTSATWQFRTPARSATTADTAYGTEMDVNGDGFTDLAVVSLNGNGGRGAVSFYFGSASGPAVLASQQILGSTAGVMFGWKVVAVGDVNGDGYADLAIGSPSDARTASMSGAVFVHSGASTGVALVASRTLIGSAANQQLGIWISPAGDVDGDGYSDLLVRGAAEDCLLFRGSSSGIGATPDVRIPSCRFATGIGDVDGDQLPDVAAVGLSRLWPQGAVFVLNGRSIGLSLAPSATLFGDASADAFGVVGFSGDGNGDGFADLVVGAPSADPGGRMDAGTINVHRGSAAGVATTRSQVLEGQTPAENLGQALLSAGDLNGDGYTEVLAGERAYSGGGRVLVFDGSGSGYRSSPTVLSGGPMSVRFGIAVASTGDCNGDGYGDVVVGDDFESTSGLVANGTARVFLGSLMGVRASAARTYSGATGSEGLGITVAQSPRVRWRGRSQSGSSTFHTPSSRTSCIVNRLPTP